MWRANLCRLRIMSRMPGSGGQAVGVCSGPPAVPFPAGSSSLTPVLCANICCVCSVAAIPDCFFGDLRFRVKLWLSWACGYIINLLHHKHSGLKNMHLLARESWGGAGGGRGSGSGHGLARSSAQDLMGYSPGGSWAVFPSGGSMARESHSEFGLSVEFIWRLWK